MLGGLGVLLFLVGLVLAVLLGCHWEAGPWGMWLLRPVFCGAFEALCGMGCFLIAIVPAIWFLVRLVSILRRQA